VAVVDDDGAPGPVFVVVAGVVELAVAGGRAAEAPVVAVLVAEAGADDATDVELALASPCVFVVELEPDPQPASTSATITAKTAFTFTGRCSAVGGLAPARSMRVSHGRT